MAPAHDHVDDEMHELNQEADYLDQTVTVATAPVNGRKAKERGDNDPDAQAQVISSLRSQIQDLFSQVSQLNNKLVKSYDRVSDLEDQLHVTSDNLRNATLKVSQLELEQAQHLSALSTGLLVEKSHVTSELTRLMEKATEEAARAGEAESARNAIEKDLDDLSAGLFGQANIMVAEARLARARSERKVEETEEALKGAEEIVGILQTQLQSLQAEKEESDRKVQEMQALMGTGKWVEPHHASGRAPRIRLLCLHAPYGEYIQFIAHLRSARPSTVHAPAMSTLLPQPFLARLVAEDSDPTVRLDLAPQLNWLTRRSVISALYSGQLSIEPMSTTTLLEELTPSLIPGTHNTHISCAMCGANIMDTPTSPSRSSFSPTRSASGNKAQWGSGLLKTSLVQSITASSFGSSRPATPTTPGFEPPTQVYIFRLENTSSSGLPVALPIGGTPQQGAQARPPTIYPLCSSGWCLMRLRTTCSLWAFIRTNVVEKVWEEEPYAPPSNLNSPRYASTAELHGDEKGPLQPKPSRMGIGALWGSMSRSLSGTRTKSEPTPTGSLDGPQLKEIHEETAKAETVPRRIPPPPPPRNTPPRPPRTLPPPPPRHPPLDAPVPKSVLPPGPPPPLPKRNRQRTEEDLPAYSDEGRSTLADDKEKPPLLSPAEETERFSTPEEELAAPPIDRVPTPTSIPLPDSVPSSPVQAEAPTLPPTTEEAETTARPETPQSHTPDAKAEEPSDAKAEASSEVKTEPPSVSKPPLPPRASARAGGAPGTPPPLPRRAAARTRPTSLVPSATDTANVEAAAVAPESSGEKSAEPEKEDAIHVQTPADDHTSPDVDEHETSTVPVEHQEADATVPAIQEPEDELADGSTMGIAPASSTENLPTSGETNSLALEGHLDALAPSILHSEVASMAPSSVRNFESKEGSLQDVSLANDSDAAPDSNDAHVHHSPEDVSEVEDEGEPGTYVGNATWEERTWKELVKLREEMFWARIGGSR
ncbi:hypothetical protein PsYK624_109740 [Phanerochaete sordida]|uniref:GDP/GTP exchange factor Sec2 N-terminal domain-containing protein n=1 Tax=Phanerochaete sordida TaxID=48140 RepID=A0A9P3GJM5_9APHY|nr:hypothetical protein PsYK624_109740 [Phanerochaete sordida]